MISWSLYSMFVIDSIVKLMDFVIDIYIGDHPFIILWDVSVYVGLIDHDFMRDEVENMGWVLIDIMIWIAWYIFRLYDMNEWLFWLTVNDWLNEIHVSDWVQSLYQQTDEPDLNLSDNFQNLIQVNHWGGNIQRLI